MTALDRPHISSYVIELVVLGLFAGVTGLISRYFMYRTAYDIEFDLRNLIYEHLSTLSFGFYDRVQSGQLISRANSDIRSVQMYTTFAPLILVQCSIGVVAFGFMLYYSWLLALVALAMMPMLYRVGVRMRNMMFPISWVIQARLAGVATVVDENVNGVRVVKSFAQEEAELKQARATPRRRSSGPTSRTPTSAGSSRRGCRTSPRSGSRSCSASADGSSSTARSTSARWSRSTSTSGCSRRRS